MAILYTVLQWVFLLLGLLMILLIMLRKSEASGLSSAFGGMGGDTAFGVKGQKQLDKIITWTSAIFLLLAIILNKPSFWHAAKDVKQPTTQESGQKK